jgi:hypothetical protein
MVGPIFCIDDRANILYGWWGKYLVWLAGPIFCMDMMVNILYGW